MSYDSWKTRSPDDEAARYAPRHTTFECDECLHTFPIEVCAWADGEGSWELCPDCAHLEAERRKEGPDPMRGVEFPFADNH